MNAVRSALVVGLFASLAIAACSGSAASPSPSAVPPTDPPPTQVPGGRSADPSDPGAGGGGGGGGTNPGMPGSVPPLSVPKPGTLNPHPVPIETLEAQIDGRRVVILATWWSGIEPCYQLDSVAVKQDGNAFTIQLIEGSGPADQMCIEIAMQHAAAIDLGELAPGDYTVAAQDGTAAAIAFTID
jgi:hypothetical protein